MERRKQIQGWFLFGCLLPLLLAIIFFLYLVCPYRTRTNTCYIPSLDIHIRMERKFSTCKLFMSKNGDFGNDYIEYKTIRQGWSIGMQYHDIYFSPPGTFFVITEKNETINIHQHDFSIYEVKYELKDSLHVSHVIEGQPFYSSYIKMYSVSTFLKNNCLHIETKEHFEGLSVFDSNGTFLFETNDGAFYKGS